MSNEDFRKKFIDSINLVNWPEVPPVDKANFSNSMIIYETCLKQYDKTKSISASKFSSMLLTLLVILIMWFFNADPAYMLATMLIMKMLGLVYSQLGEFALEKMTQTARSNVSSSLEKILKNHSML